MQEQATAQVWLVDQQGLLTRDMTGLRDYQKPYARHPGEVTGWATGGRGISLLDAVRHVAPTILIGTSTAHGAFTKEVVEAMSAGTERPVIFPLSSSSATTALAVARAAAADGVAATTTKPDNLVQAVQDATWQPAYPEREE
jgi:malic enzyme